MNNHTQQDNPFAGKLATRTGGSAVAEAEIHRSVAETQAALIIAKRFPRDQIAAMDRILQAFTRPTLAEQSLYSYSRGGTEITGPSIRAAETIAQNWGNLDFGIKELSQEGGASEVMAYAWDTETNTRQVKVFKVPHIRHTRQGQYALEDPRDIYELVANQGARRLRACILGIIPGDVIEAAVNQAEKTLKAKVDVTPELIQQLLERFAEYGVTKEMIEKRIQRRIESISPASVVQLKKIYNSMKDGMSVRGDWFETAAPAGDEAGEGAPKTGAAALKASAKRKPGPQQQPKQETKPSPDDDPTLDIPGAGDISHVGGGAATGGTPKAAPAPEKDSTGTDSGPASASAPAAGAAPTITANEALALEARCTENEINVAALKKAAKVERLSMIAADSLHKAHAWIDAVIDKRKAAA